MSRTTGRRKRRHKWPNATSATATLNSPKVRRAMAEANAVRMRGQRLTAKLTVEQVRAIYLDPRPKRAIERAYGMSHGVVQAIKRGRSWANETRDLRNE